MSDDLALLQRYARRRDADAFAAIVRDYTKLVYATCLRITGNAHDAEDLTQDCFLHLARQADTVTASVPGYLHALATSRSLNALRDAATRQRHEERATARPTGTTDPSWAELAPHVDAAIAALPDELRLALVEHYLQGRTQADIAAELGINQATVSRRLAGAIEQARANLAKAGMATTSAFLTGCLSEQQMTAIPTSLGASLGKLAVAGIGHPARAMAGGMTLKAKVLIVAAVLLALTVAGVQWFRTTPHKEIAMPASRSAPATVPADGGQPKTPAASRVIHEDGSVYLPGLEDAEWGNATERQDSVLACVSEIVQYLGEKTTYDEVMGLGGSAFRLQMSQGKMEPSSPNAGCGRNDFNPALAAFGYRGTAFDMAGIDKPLPSETVNKARQAIVKSIDAGVPVIYCTTRKSLIRKEASLIVGYADSGASLLLRQYSPQARGYETTTELPLVVLVITPADARPARREAILASLKAAVEMAYTPAYGQFDSGFAAYRNWAKHLRGEVGMDEMLGNGYTYGCLWSQRQMAFTYLRRVAGEFGPTTEAHLKAAADYYERICKTMSEKRPDLRDPWMYMPWDLNGNWTPAQRQAQAAMLDEVAQIEVQAISELEQALASESIATTRPATQP